MSWCEPGQGEREKICFLFLNKQVHKRLFLSQTWRLSNCFLQPQTTQESQGKLPLPLKSLPRSLRGSIPVTSPGRQPLHGGKGWRPSGPCFTVQETPVLLTKPEAPQAPPVPSPHPRGFLFLHLFPTLINVLPLSM